MKCKKFITGIFSLALVPLLALNVNAAGDSDLQAILDTLNQNIEKSQQISDAINGGSPTGTISDMIDSVEDVNPSELDTIAPTDQAPAAGSLADFGSDDSTDSFFMFAKLQMELINSLKNNAAQSMNNITNTQSKMNQISKYVQQIRDLVPNVDAGPVSIPSEILNYMNENGLSYPTPDLGLYTPSQCQQIIDSLQDNLDAIGNSVQNDMISIQDFMGQYTSGVTDIRNGLLNFKDDPSSVSKGQSIFSTKSGSVNVTPVALCILAGTLLGMLIMWGIMKKGMKMAKKEESV